MKLYRLKDKRTGKFLASGSYLTKQFMSWTSTGSYFKRIDTMKRHLNNLCHDIIIKRDENSQRWWFSKQGFYPERASFYEVIINETHPYHPPIPIHRRTRGARRTYNHYG